MRKKIWVHKAQSFEAAQEFDDLYYLSMSPNKRLDTMQFLREQYHHLGNKQTRENRKRLRRVLRIIKQA